MPKIGKKEIKGRFVIPSGIVATSLDTLLRIAKEIPEVGILTTKTITLNPREGNPEPILEQVGHLSFVNAVGLTNPGAEYFRKELKKIYPLPKGKFLLVSIAPSTKEELKKIIKIISPFFDGVELNFSCPHGGKYGLIIGRDRELSFEFTKVARQTTKKPVFVKLPPIKNIGEIAKTVIEAGTDGITAINTIGPVKSRILSFGKGGLSGAKIKRRGIQCVREIKKAIPVKIPLIAMGGIGTARDVKLYQEAGADFFGIGSSLAGMDFQRVKDYFEVLEKDLERGTNRAEKLLLKKKFINYQIFKIKKIKSLSNDLKIYYFDKPLKSEPGQFVFLNFEKREKPFSIASDKPLVLVVRKVGDFTSKIFRLKKGNKTLIRGPYGKPFPIFKNKENYLVCGGTGTAPLYFLAQKLSMRKARLRPSGFGNANEHIRITIFLAGKTKKELLFKDEFKKLGKLIIATEDGNEGARGRVTEVLERYLRENKPKNVVFFNCGPELMLKKAMDIEKKYSPPEKIFSLTERIMKCGFGICGHCALNGKLTCVDGPYFNYSTLKKCRHFGKFKRDKTGRLVSLE
ncbi:MAG: hypothetical protein COT33_01255 [Candidatus Nealsonbacteria bacterium CG08_land_8_20_14_0_20_38_20]|uniref:FAD-binding FR-type domain-containing protein n=1 Tax=Candidatus Nealsonbacteria bacterium CG08_land_8_20_14_0_20_38_20 TaxID=1974705 RepID=A0A2H0YM92_9BACT|nr:MAG: hypothetical protein COT33_01255 [Candidatus Nealsonbacteria bacterium CG08_land_8_20_14_0_20_38_20]